MADDKQEVTLEDVVANMLIEHGALIALLLEKGIIKEEEFDKKTDEVAKDMS
jgi:hypothetical protein